MKAIAREDWSVVCAGWTGKEEVGREVRLRLLYHLHSGRATGSEIEAAGAGSSGRRRGGLYMGGS